MSVTEYEARFTELSHHVTFLIPTEAEKVRRFMEGLNYGIRVTMACESEMGLLSVGSRDSSEDRVCLQLG